MADVVMAVPGPADGAAEALAPAAPMQDDAANKPWSHPSGIVPQLQNVVSTVNLGCQLDLASIAQRARNAEYNPKRFAACIVRIRDPKTTALMFNSGKMVIAGAKSEEQSRLAGRKYTKILVKLGYSCTFRDFTVQNMVASCSVNFPIRLEGLAAHFDMFVHYEPEVFPGLVFRMHTPKVVLLIFVTGKLVITGAKNIGDIHTAFDNIYAVLQDHRKGDARRLVRTEPNTPAAAITANGEAMGTMLPGPDNNTGLDALGNLTITGAGADGAGPSGAGPSSAAPAPQPGNTIPAPAAVNHVPAPTPGNFIPPPTPVAGNFIPPPTPAQTIPPATPAATIPPASPAPRPTMLPPPAQ